MKNYKAAAVLFFASTTALAGGALRLGNNDVILWDSSFAIPYQVDRGDLSSGIDHAAAVAMVTDSFQTWENVPTSNLSFLDEGLLPINVSTAAEYLPYDSGAEPVNAVIFDEQGAIIQGLLGQGQQFFILGWAAPMKNVAGTELVGFVSLMNGNLAISTADFTSTVVHEFGHSIGLDHTQINVQFAGNGIAADDVNLPTMYPTDSDDNTVMSQLNPDDIAWVSKFYPSDDFDQEYGLITGTLVRTAGTEVLGANVIAVRQDSPLLHIYSNVSGYRDDGTSTFEIPVTPGEYRLQIEPINPRFKGGSSVGPFAEADSGLSFQNPVLVKVFTDNIDVTAGNTADVGELQAD